MKSATEEQVSFSRGKTTVNFRPSSGGYLSLRYVEGDLLWEKEMSIANDFVRKVFKDITLPMSPAPIDGRK
jgi:hypothetical protein